jgi:hypothetical protein
MLHGLFHARMPMTYMMMAGACACVLSEQIGLLSWQQGQGKGLMCMELLSTEKAYSCQNCSVIVLCLH